MKESAPKPEQSIIPVISWSFILSALVLLGGCKEGAEYQKQREIAIAENNRVDLTLTPEKLQKKYSIYVGKIRRTNGLDYFTPILESKANSLVGFNKLAQQCTIAKQILSQKYGTLAACVYTGKIPPLVLGPLNIPILNNENVTFIKEDLEYAPHQ
jgi:hypothetical protein